MIKKWNHADTAIVTRTIMCPETGSIFAKNTVVRISGHGNSLMIDDNTALSLRMFSLYASDGDWDLTGLIRSIDKKSETQVKIEELEQKLAELKAAHAREAG